MTSWTLSGKRARTGLNKVLQTVREGSLTIKGLKVVPREPPPGRYPFGPTWTKGDMPRRVAPFKFAGRRPGRLGPGLRATLTI